MKVSAFAGELAEASMLVNPNVAGGGRQGCNPAGGSPAMTFRFGHVGIAQLWRVTSSPLRGVNALAALHGTELSAAPPWCLIGMPGGVGGASYPDYTNRYLNSYGTDRPLYIWSFLRFRRPCPGPKMLRSGHSFWPIPKILWYPRSTESGAGDDR